MTESRFKLSPYYLANLERNSGSVYPVEVDHKGVTGVVRIAFTSTEHAHVSTEAHVNDDLAGLEYRGRGFLFSVHMYLRDGAWVLGEYPVHGTRRDSWSDATATEKKKLAEAALVAMAKIAETDQGKFAMVAGERWHAQIDLDSAQRKIDELTPKIKEARAELRKATKRLVDAQGAYDAIN
jgi:hypothetical protein